MFNFRRNSSVAAAAAPSAANGSAPTSNSTPTTGGNEHDQRTPQSEEETRERPQQHQPNIRRDESNTLQLAADSREALSVPADGEEEEEEEVNTIRRADTIARNTDGADHHPNPNDDADPNNAESDEDSLTSPSDDTVDSSDDEETIPVNPILDRFRAWRYNYVDRESDVIAYALKRKGFLSAYYDKLAHEKETQQKKKGEATEGQQNGTQECARGRGGGTSSEGEVDAPPSSVEVIDKYFIPKTEDDYFIALKDYEWRGILSKNYADRPDLMPAPRGTRDPHRRFPWETALFDVCLVLPMGDFDVEFLLSRFMPIVKEEIPARLTLRKAKHAFHSDFHFVIMLACAVFRRWMSEFCPRHADCGAEIVAARYTEVMQAAGSILSSLTLARAVGGSAGDGEEEEGGEDEPISDPMGNYIFKYLLEMRQLAARHMARLLCDMTKAPTRPISLVEEALRVGEIQKRRVRDRREPKLDLDERTSAEMADYIRKCAPLWAADVESTSLNPFYPSVDDKKEEEGEEVRTRLEKEESNYLTFLVSSLPRVMSVPHPLSAFAVRPYNPIVALGNHFTCDLCYTPHIRASYQAVMEEGGEEDENLKGEESSDGKEKVKKTEEQRNAVELIKNCFGFDLCLRCSAQYYNESLKALASATLLGCKPLHALSDSTGEAVATESALGAKESKLHTQVALCEFIGSPDIVASPLTNPSSPTSQRVWGTTSSKTPKIDLSSSTTASPTTMTAARSVVHARLSLVAVGSRPIIDINNQLRVVDTTVVRLKQHQPHHAHDPHNNNNNTIAGTLIIKCAVAPLGARPIGRKWRPSFAEIVEERAKTKVKEEFESESTQIKHSVESPATKAAAELLAYAEALEPYLSSASRCFAKRCLSSEERSFMLDNAASANAEDGADDEEEENTCPICIEPLAPRARVDASVLNNADDNIVERDFYFLGTGNERKGEQSIGGEGGGEGDSTTSADNSGNNTAVNKKTSGSATSSSAATRAVVQTHCRHWFHAHCIDRFFAESKTTSCPLCRTPEALDTLTARRFMKKKTNNSAVGERGAGENAEDGEDHAAAAAGPTTAHDENTVTPAMISEEANRNLQQNVYELCIPLTQAEIERGLAHTKKKNQQQADDTDVAELEPLRVLVGTLVSLDCQYHNPSDIGCLAQIEVSLFDL